MARIQADGPAEEETNGSAISQRPRAPTKSRRHPGLHEIAPAIRGPKESAPAIRGPDESAPAISLGGFVGWFRGVVS